MNWGATDEFDQHISRPASKSAQIKVATEEADPTLPAATSLRSAANIVHVTDFSNWLKAKIQGAEVASWCTPGIRRDSPGLPHQPGGIG
jgi:hypothetical protein